MHKNRDVKGIKRALIALTVIGMLMAGDVAFSMDITSTSTVLINENDPQVLSRVREMGNENIAKTKNLNFNIGRDNNNNKLIINNKLADICLLIEDRGYDAFSVSELTLKTGKKIAGISVLARIKDGQFNKFMEVMKELIGSKADDGNCVVTISQIKEFDRREVYSIYFDYEYDDVVEAEETVTPSGKDDKVQPKGCLFPF